jgi:Spy/CpxP family protein refolding chaperone
LEKLKTKGDVIMKKLTTIFGITLLSALLIVPLAVWAHGWGAGGGHMMGYWGGGPGHMMGYWGGGPGNYNQYDRDYNTLNSKQQEQLADLNRKFYDETRTLRDKLWSKSAELNALLSETSPDSGKISKLQKEISNLQAKLDEKAINNEIEARKIAPDTRFGGGYGYGPMMGGYGMGYGPGACWN